jgi:hypothetical protein
VGEIDSDAERIKNLALKLERQSFAYQQMVVFGAPARSRRFVAESVRLFRIALTQHT